MLMSRKVSAVSAAAMLGCLLFAGQTAKASVWNKKTTVKFPEAVELPGSVTLQPGSYVLKLADSASNRHIVQVFNENETKIFATILAIPAQRMEPADKTIISFYETPRTQPMFIKQWFYPGDTIGQEFAYSKDRAAYIASLSRETVPVRENNQVAQMTPEDAGRYSQPAVADTDDGVNEDGSYAVEHGYGQNEAVADSMEEDAEAAPLPVTEYEQPVYDNEADYTNSEDDQVAAAPVASDQDPMDRLPQTATNAPLAGLAGLTLFGLGGVAWVVRKYAFLQR